MKTSASKLSLTNSYCFSVIALSKLFSLNDPRVAQIMVRGDMIMPTSDRILTRSRARQSKSSHRVDPVLLLN